MIDISINIIRKCKARDKDAFNLLFSRYEGYLYRLCYHYLQNKEDALDVMQEIFIKVFRSIDTFDESRDFPPWLKKIAVNTCLNYLRDKDRKFHLSLDYEKEDQWAFSQTRTGTGNEDIAEQVIKHTTGDAIRKCMDQLPPGPRMVLTLRYVQEMSCQEIAEILDKPVGTVKNSLFRARSHLKTVLEQYGLMEV